MSQSHRLHNLDALRSFCMIYGVFFHALKIGEFGALELIYNVSGYFRMSTFFAVSALLAVLMMQRTGPQHFLPKRFVAFLVPLTFGILVLNPLTIMLVHRYFGLDPAGPMSALAASGEVTPEEAPRGSLLHLWFLVSLTVYTALAWPLWSLLKSRRVDSLFDRLERTVPARLLPLLLAAGAFAIALPIQTLEAIMLPGERARVFETTLRYIPFYLFGMVLGVRPELRRMVCHPNAILIGICVLLFGLQAVLGPLRGAADSVFRLLLFSVVNICAIMTLIGVSDLIFRQSHHWVTVFTRSMYTVYLIHMLLIYTLATLLTPIGLRGPVLYITVVGITLAIGVTLHERVIRRSPGLMFLFNGRIPDSWLARITPPRRATPPR